MGACGLTFCYKALRKNKSGWGLILSTSYVTPIFLNFALFDGVLDIGVLGIFLHNRCWEWSWLKQFKFSPDDKQSNQNVVKTFT